MSHTFTRAYYYYYSPAPLQAVLNNLQVGTIASSSSSRHYPTRRVLLPLAYIYARPHAALHAQPRPRVPDRGARSARLTHRRDASDDDDEHSNCEMGACNSCEATAVAAVNGRSASGEATAARVVLADGALRRFPGGTRASQAVKAAGGGGGGSSWFLCSADGLELGAAVAAVGGGDDEELQPGQLYFVLPAAMRRRPLQAEEMAALAVRASAALVGDHDGPLVFPEAAASAADPRAAGKGCRRSRTRRHSRGRDFVPDLGAIAE